MTPSPVRPRPSRKVTVSITTTTITAPWKAEGLELTDGEKARAPAEGDH